MAKLTKNLAPLFDSSISYEPGERFMYGDHMYEVIEPLTGVFDLTKVSEVTLVDIFKGVSSNDVKCLAPEYDVNTEYSVENLVLHDGVLYECVETTTGPFDETKWSRKYLSDVGGLNSNLVNITVVAQPQDNDSTAVGRNPCVTLDLESNGIYLISSGTWYNPKQDITITVNNGDVEIITEENRVPETRTGDGCHGVYLKFIKVGKNGANATIQGKPYTIFSVYRIY